MSALSIIAVPAVGSAAAGTAVASPQEVGQAPGRDAVAVIHSPGGAFVGTVKLQTSDDNSSWADAATAQAMTGPGIAFIAHAAARFYRLNVTAWTSGSISATVIS
jgi:hypothetical protein